MFYLPIHLIINFQWQDVLSVVAKALDENDISYRHITSGSKQFQVSSVLYHSSFKFQIAFPACCYIL